MVGVHRFKALRMNLSSGRADEFAQLLAQHEARLFGYIHALVMNTADAEEVYQDTVLALWRKFDQFRPETNFVAWARAVAHFEVRHYFRAAGRRRRHFDPVLLDEIAETQSLIDQSDAPSVESDFDALRKCKELLPESDQRLIEMCYLASVGVSKTAQRLGRSPQSVCNSLSRIRRALFDCIRKATEARDQ
jgi:RNA polymerase sigma-70 factor (ECF subfamily)